MAHRRVARKVALVARGALWVLMFIVIAAMAIILGPDAVAHYTGTCGGARHCRLCR